ncbi:MAG TPA: pyrroloquinoline quinone biosynthesis peptide chaperone PqqD [Burkholderiales bacterium]|jgi:pyrroloquinoline quinone biosynthesis protein D|nr:pyrroloquinoline quinone biosynthesis peptide chaperone PqqD [Burkholderiales bacterium]
MNCANAFGAHERPVINPLFLLRWEHTQQAYVLLYPEGVVKLNDTAGEILKRCDGRHTVGELVEEITREFAADPARIGESVQKFLEVSHAKGWIRRQA